MAPEKAADHVARVIKPETPLFFAIAPLPPASYTPTTTMTVMPGAMRMPRSLPS